MQPLGDSTRFLRVGASHKPVSVPGVRETREGERMDRRRVILTAAGVLIGLSLAMSEGVALLSAAGDEPSRQDGSETRAMIYPPDGSFTGKRDPYCRKARKKADEPGRCKKGRPHRASKRKRATRAMLERDGALRSLDGDQVRLDQSRRRVYYKTAHQCSRGLYYINWKTCHNATFYFNGARVWIHGKRHNGHHRCGEGYGYGYDVNTLSCFADAHPTTDGTRVWHVFKVHAVWKGFPISKTYNHHFNIYPSGSIYWHW